MENMEIVLVVILIVLVVALFVISYMKKKRYNAELGQMREELHNGDRVMTDTGVVGEVVDSYVEDEYKYFVLKTGKGNNIGYFTVHANAIYYVFGKEDNATTAQDTKTKKVKVAVKPDTASVENEKTVDNLTTAKTQADSDTKTSKNASKSADEKEGEKVNSTATASNEKSGNSKSKKNN